MKPMNRVTAAVGTVAVVALLAGLVRPQPAAADHTSPSCRARGPQGNIEQTNLGTAVAGLYINQMVVIGDTTYTISMRQDPPRFTGFDLSSGEVVVDAPLPTGAGSWQTTTVDGDVYFIVYGTDDTQDNLYRFDTASSELTGLGRLPTSSYDLSSDADGTLYAAAEETGVVYTYETSTGERGQITYDDEGPNYSKSVAVTSDTLFVGTSGLYTDSPGHPADLFAIDRDTGAQSQLLPDTQGWEVADVYPVEASEQLVVAAAGSPARLLVASHDGADTTTVILDDESYIDAAEVVGDETVYFTGKARGTLYRYDVGSDQVTELATPIPRAPTRNLYLRGGTLIGVSQANTVWTYDLNTGELARFDLLAAGATGSPGEVFSLAATGGAAYAGGSNAVQVRDTDSGAVDRFILPGEPKDLASVDGAVYAAMYPYGELWRYEAGDGPRPVADWDDDFNRPITIHRDRDEQRFLISTRNDLDQTGAVIVFDEIADTTTAQQPLGDELVLSMAGLRDTTFLGGGSGTLAAWNPDSGGSEPRWEMTPVPDGGGITGLASFGGHVYGLTADGTFFAVEVASQTVEHTEQVLSGETGEVAFNEGFVYAVGKDQLLRVDPDNGYAVESIATDLGAQAFNIIPMTTGNDCAVYAPDGGELLQVTTSNDG